MPRAVADVESDGSEDLEDLPGPDEFLQTAVRELTQRRTPEFGRPSGRANATNRAGHPRAGANAGSGTEDETDDATTTYDDYERSAIDEFLATSAPPAPASVATSAASPGGRKTPRAPRIRSGGRATPAIRAPASRYPRSSAWSNSRRR